MPEKIAVRPWNRVSQAIRRVVRSTRLEIMLNAVLFLIGLTEIIKEV